MKRHVSRHGRRDRIAAVQRRESRRQRHRDRHVAMLGVAGRPVDQAGVRIQSRASGQPGSAVAERNVGSVGLAQTARHASTELQREAIAFAQRLRRDVGQHRLRITLRDDDVELLDDGCLAVARDDRQVPVRPGLIVSGRPAQHAGARVEACARRQVPHGQRDEVSVVVRGRQWEGQGIPFGQRQGADLADRRGMIATGHGDVVDTQGDPAATVLHADEDPRIGRVARAGRPVQDGSIVVAGAIRRHGGRRRQRHAGGGIHQLPEELAPIGVVGL